MLQQSCNFHGPALSTYLVIMLTSFPDTKYILNEHEDLGQYPSYAKPSEIMSSYSYAASLVLSFH